MSEFEGIGSILEQARKALERDLEKQLIYGEQIKLVYPAYDPAQHVMNLPDRLTISKERMRTQMEKARRQTLERPGIVPIIYGSPKPTCEHEWINVSFSHIHMVCKHCDQEQPT